MGKLCYGCMQMKQQSPICEHCDFDENSGNRPHQLPIGTILHKQYVIGRVLGQGGFGITYIGWDAALETKVAIKEYYPNNFVSRDCRTALSVSSISEGADRFFRHSREHFIKEAKILAKLRSVPGIVRIQRMFEENNTVYIVMEYVQGVNLKSYMQTLDRPLSAEETFAVMRPVIYTLGKVHEAELIHRDISPDNIMIQNDGKVKLLDFGSAREVENMDVGMALPQSTEVILKHGFAPIEQYGRRGSIGSWTDIYALCATMYYCMTGTVPCGALERLVGEDNVNWHQIPGLTESQIDTLERGLDVRPEKRIQSAQDLWQELFEQKKEISEEAYEDDSASEEEASQTVEISQANGKKKSNAVIAGALLAVIAAVGLFAVKTGQTKDTAVCLQNTEICSTEGNRPEETVSDAAQQDTEAAELTCVSWENNTLVENPEAYFGGIEKANIISVTFLPTVADCPAGCWDVSQKQDKSVLAWAEERGGFYDLFIAAEGGINAANACSGLFENYEQLKEVNFNHCFHTEATDDMRDMFRRCASIVALDLSDFDTSGVTNMSAMFAGCEKLETINLEGFNTSSVTDMSYMFNSCKSLVSLDLCHFDTSCVTNMCSMFGYCEALPELDLSGFNTSCVTDMRNMFSDCYNLTSLNVSGFVTDKVEDMRYMFYKCRSLTALDLSSFNTSNVSSMCQMFSYCENIASLDLSNFDFYYVSDLSGIFSYCLQLDHLDLGDFDVSPYTNTENMYLACYKLSSKYKRRA